MIVWFTGQPGSGKTTLKKALAQWEEGWGAVTIDGDEMRELMPNPGYDEAGRRQNIDRAQTLAAHEHNQGRFVIVALVAPYLDQREAFKARFPVLEVYLSTTEIRGREHYFVSEYEPPEQDFIHIDTGEVSVEQAIRIIHRALPATP